MDCPAGPADRQKVPYYSRRRSLNQACDRLGPYTRNEERSFANIQPGRDGPVRVEQVFQVLGSFGVKVVSKLYAGTPTLGLKKSTCVTPSKPWTKKAVSTRTKVSEDVHVLSDFRSIPKSFRFDLSLIIHPCPFLFGNAIPPGGVKYPAGELLETRPCERQHAQKCLSSASLLPGSTPPSESKTFTPPPLSPPAHSLLLFLPPQP